MKSQLPPFVRLCITLFVWFEVIQFQDTLRRCCAFVLPLPKQYHSNSRNKNYNYNLQNNNIRIPNNGVLLFAMQITVRIVGRENGAGEGKWMTEACQMYETRLKPNNIQLTTLWYKDNSALLKAVGVGTNNSNNSNKNTITVLLDPTGMKYTSEQFSLQLYNWFEVGGSRLSIIIGGGKYVVIAW